MFFKNINQLCFIKDKPVIECDSTGPYGRSGSEAVFNCMIYSRPLAETEVSWGAMGREEGSIKQGEIQGDYNLNKQVRNFGFLVPGSFYRS